MRDNFRPNVRLATNILMVIGTFLIAYKIGSIGKYEKTFQQRKANCARTMAIDIPELKQQFLEKYDLDIYNSYLSVDEVIKEFCFFYTK